MAKPKDPGPVEITGQHLKKCKRVRLPVGALYEHRDKAWHPKQVIVSTERTAFELGDTFFRGKVLQGTLFLEELRLLGPRSGAYWLETWLPALTHSSGTLKLVLVWDRGEEVQIVRIRDGQVKVKPLD